MHETLEDEVRRVVAGMDNQEHQEPETEIPGTTGQEPEPEETIHIHYFPDAIVVFKEEAPEPGRVVDSTPVIPQKISVIPAYTICLFYLMLILSCIAFQAYEILYPPIATVTIIPRSQQVTLTGTLQIGRLLNPLTLSQSQTVPTTGKGHQDAKQAYGAITFYNGLFTSQTIAQGTILTGADGVQIITDQDATIPAANPPIFGQVTISAHATNPGVRGNIPAYDINQACCSNAVLAKNTQPFTGGQDERTYTTLTQKDINSISTVLKTSLSASMQGALHEQLKPTEQLSMLPCTPTVTSDHQIGEEATQAKVTVSETCSAFAYNSQAVEEKATALLTHQAATKLGTGYSLFGEVKVTITQATATHTTTPLVFLSFHASGTWIYALNKREQQQIKSLIAGRTKQQALRELLSLPGVEQAVIRWGDDTRLPKNSSYIHIRIFVV